MMPLICGSSESQDNSLNPGFDGGDVEVDEQSEPDSAEFEIRKHLGLVHRKDLFHSLQFNDDAACNNNIEPEPRIQSQPVI